jgi:hypothetical protein
MTTALISYQFDEAPVRVVMIADEPWFVANDIAMALGYERSSFMTRLLDDDEKGVHIVHTLGGKQELNIVSESGLYHAAIKRRGKEAQRFRKWVTAEVLPTLRRTGRYEMPGAPPVPPLMDTDPARLNACVATVREARRLFGPATARQVWIRLGLPVAIAEAKSNHVGDALAEPLKQWLIGKTECTAKDAAEGIGIENPQHGDLQRIGGLMRLFGWTSAKVRVGHKTFNQWIAPARQPWHGIVAVEEE